jgi:hypothetical protein
MLTDTSPDLEIKVGDIIWVFDMFMDMKIPLSVVEVMDDGGWKGALTWTWGEA